MKWTYLTPGVIATLLDQVGFELAEELILIPFRDAADVRIGRRGGCGALCLEPLPLLNFSLSSAPVVMSRSTRWRSVTAYSYQPPMRTLPNESRG